MMETVAAESDKRSVPPLQATQNVGGSPPTTRRTHSPLQSQGSTRTFELPRLVEFNPAASTDRNASRRRKRAPKVRSFIFFNLS